MIDPLTLLAIGASIGSMISGFRDAKLLFRNWLKKRKEKRLAKDENLGDTLDSSRKGVQRSRDDGQRRFGHRFLRGDDISRSAILQTLIRMNENLVEILKKAASPAINVVINCSNLRIVATTTRDESVGILNQLMQRLAAQEPIRRPIKSNGSSDKMPIRRPIKRNGSSDKIPIEDAEVDWFPRDTWAPESGQTGCSASTTWQTGLTDLEERYFELSSTHEPTPPKLPSLFKSLSRVDTTTSLRRSLRSVSDRTESEYCWSPTRTHVPVDDLSSDLSTASTALPRFKDATISSVTSDEVLARNVEQLRSMSMDTPGCLPSRESHYSRSARSKRHSSPDTRAPYGREEAWRSEVQSYQESWISPVTSAEEEFGKAKGAQSQSRVYRSASPLAVPERFELEAISRSTFKTQTPITSRITTKTPDRSSAGRSKTTGRTAGDATSSYRGKMHAPKAVQPDVTVSTREGQASAISGPFCSAAISLQDDSIFESARAAITDGLCEACGCRMPIGNLMISIYDDQGGGTASASLWEVTAGFMTKCHKPGERRGGPVAFGCVICGPDGLTMRGRNELWAHLECHSAAALEGEKGVVMVK